uniref:Uncharacterized protein n=1 Tax=Arundo donax TaxID=35708 RepID=A0A0A9E6N0_ARUDO
MKEGASPLLTSNSTGRDKLASTKSSAFTSSCLIGSTAREASLFLAGGDLVLGMGSAPIFLRKI